MEMRHNRFLIILYVIHFVQYTMRSYVMLHSVNSKFIVIDLDYLHEMYCLYACDIITYNIPDSCNSFDSNFLCGNLGGDCRYEKHINFPFVNNPDFMDLLFNDEIKTL